MTVDADEVRFPFMFSLLALGLGIALLAIILVISTSSGAAAESNKVNSATQAAKIAINSLPRSDRIIKIDSVEIVKGMDENHFLFDTWHVQIDVYHGLAQSNGSEKTTMSQVVRDVLIDPKTASTFLVRSSH